MSADASLDRDLRRRRRSSGIPGASVRIMINKCYELERRNAEAVVTARVGPTCIMMAHNLTTP